MEYQNNFKNEFQRAKKELKGIYDSNHFEQNLYSNKPTPKYWTTKYGKGIYMQICEYLCVCIIAQQFSIFSDEPRKPGLTQFVIKL